MKNELQKIIEMFVPHKRNLFTNLLCLHVWLVVFFYRGSREFFDPSMSYHSDYHKGAASDEEEEDNSEEEEEEEGEALPYKPSTAYQQQQPQFNAPAPTYDVYAQQGYPSQGYQPPDPGYQVAYQPDPQTMQLQDPSVSQDKSDTFV